MNFITLGKITLMLTSFANTQENVQEQNDGHSADSCEAVWGADSKKCQENYIATSQPKMPMDPCEILHGVPATNGWARVACSVEPLRGII